MNTMNHITPHSRICAAINLDAVRHNLKAIQSLLTPHTQIMAVIKTDAYGHGAAEIAKPQNHMNSCTALPLPQQRKHYPCAATASKSPS